MKRWKKNVLTILVMGVFGIAGAVYAAEVAGPGSSAPVEITTDRLPVAYSGDDYSTLFAAKGGTGPIHYSGAALPASLSLSDGGRLSGRLKTGPGEYRLKVTATDSGPSARSDVREYVLSVYDHPELPRVKLPPAVTGVYYRGEIAVRGGSSKRSLTMGGLPEGLTMDETGVVSGIPLAQAGSYSVKARLSDEAVRSDAVVEREYDLKIYPPITITNVEIPPVLTGTRFSIRFRASGGSGDVVFSGADLPRGLVMNRSGKLEGTVEMKRGEYAFTVKVDDDKTHTAVDKTFILKVIDFKPDTFEPLGDDELSSKNTVRPGTAGQYHTFDRPGDRDVTVADLNGAVENTVVKVILEKGTRATPVHLSIYSPDRRLLLEKDTPGEGVWYVNAETPGLYPVVIETVPGGTGDCTLRIESPGRKIRIATPELSVISKYQPSEFTLRVDGGSGSYRFSGSGLPDGLSLTKEGRIQGSPKGRAGTYSFSCRLEDGEQTGMGDEKTYILTMVDFFPDAFEMAGDDTPATHNTLKPDDPVQSHTFNRPGDVDMVRIAGSPYMVPHVVFVETLPLTHPTRTEITSYGSDGKPLTSVSAANGLYLEWRPSEPIMIGIREHDDRTGDYLLRVTDRGPKAALGITAIPDALSRGDYRFQLVAELGSGNFRYDATDLPKGLTMTPTGMISGSLNRSAGSERFTVTVTDIGYGNMTTKTAVALAVVDYYPDGFETDGDSDFNTSVVMVPGGETQGHTFHCNGDVDMIRLDLQRCKAGNVIRVLSPGGTGTAGTALELFDQGRTSVITLDRKGLEDLTLVYQLKVPGDYFLRMTQREGVPGEYRIRSDDCGPKVALGDSPLPDAESERPYHAPIKTCGGMGAYLYRISSGDLPAGLSLDRETGVISGQNTSWGKKTFTVTVCDRRYPENTDTRDFTVDAFMGRKLSATGRLMFPHYVSGTFSLESRTVTTTAFPGMIDGGTPGNLRFRIVRSTIPDRFSYRFDDGTGAISLTDKSPVSCDQYEAGSLDVTVEVYDRIYTNNVCRIHYDIPVQCLTY